jgi:hypothetical protein
VAESTTSNNINLQRGKILKAERTAAVLTVRHLVLVRGYTVEALRAMSWDALRSLMAAEVTAAVAGMFLSWPAAERCVEWVTAMIERELPHGLFLLRQLAFAGRLVLDPAAISGSVEAIATNTFIDSMRSLQARF